MGLDFALLKAMAPWISIDVIQTAEHGEIYWQDYKFSFAPIKIRFG